MPSIDAVDRIKKVVNSLGNEEAILQQKGVAIEDVLPPSDEMDGDLQDLLSTGPEEDGMTTMDSLLSSLDAELPEEDFPLDILSEDPENDLALTDAPLPPTDDFDLPDDDILGGLDDLDLADEGDVLAGLGDLDLTDEGDALAGLGDLDLTGEGETLGELGDLDLTGEGEALGELGELDLTGEGETLEELDDLDLTGEGETLGELGDLDLTGEGEALGELGDLDLTGEGETLEELGELSLPEEGSDEAAELEDLDDFNLTDLSLEPDELEQEELAPDSLEIPDADSAMEDLAESLDGETGLEENRGEEIVLDEDFGLNEIDDDFLDEFNESDEDQFSLDDLGAEYNFTEDETSDLSAELGLDLDELEKDINRTAEDEAAQNFEMTEEELERLEAALYALPLNLKIALQDFFSDESSAVDQLNKMTDQLLNGASPRSIATTYRKFTGKKIDIPRGYEKKSGEEFARERASLATYVKEKILPRIALGLGIYFTLWGLFLILFNFVYRPLKAESLYNHGAEEIGLDNYAAGEEYFNSAFFGWDIGPLQVRGVRRQDKFFLYADEYVKRKNYRGAEEKYRQLLQAYPGNEKGRVAYGNLLKDKLVRYRDAEYILKGADPLMLAEATAGDIPYENIPLKEITEINDVDRLICLGDNYLEWAAEDPEKYESARYIYATLLKEKSGGDTDEVLLRMFRLQIRRDNESEIERLRQLYKERERISAEPTLQAEVFSELAGWLIDNERVLESRDFILKAQEADKTVPGSHYQYARFFHETYNPQGEKNALTNALGYLDRMTDLDKEHIFMQIDSYRRMGNLSLYVGDYEKAERQFLMALEIYENSRRLNLIGTSPEIGALYGELGHLNYDHYGDYDRALEYYELARQNLGDTPDIGYREGFIHYSIKKDYGEALLEFYRVSRYYPEKGNLLLAMGNALLQRGDYYGAVSHYEQFLSQLEEQERNIKVLLPDEKEEEWALIEYLIMTHNNLGVAQSGVSRKSPNRSMENQALGSFTASSEYFDKLLRNRNTSQRTELVDRAGENRQALLAGSDSEELQLYDEILPHLDDLPRFYRNEPIE